MGTEDKPQFKSSNGNVYIFKAEEKRWYIFGPTETLPSDVKAQLKELNETAVKLKDT